MKGKQGIIEEMGQYERQEGGSAVFRYCALILVVLMISLFSGCSSPPITQENIIQKLHALVRSPNIQFNYARFYHQGDHSVVSIHYKNTGASTAYSMVTDLKVY